MAVRNGAAFRSLSFSLGFRGVSIGLAALLCGTSASTAALAQKYDGSGSPTFVPHTLQQALAFAYLNNPQLQAERANLRSVDENVPTALAGWRPTVQLAGTASYYQGKSGAIGGGTALPVNTPGYTLQATATQPIYNGGRTTSQTHEAVNRVMSERATLIATEQTVLTNVVQAYVSVIEDEQLLQLNINNEKVLTEQLRATNDRFRVGEITRTDVAQAESALASARAQRQQSEGTLKTAQATYTQQVGAPPPPNLVPPQPLALPVKTEKEAQALAISNNPNVISALFLEASDKDAVDVAFSALMPKLSAQAQVFKNVNQGYEHYSTHAAEALLNLSIPLYQGGSEYAAIRQARQNAEVAHRQVDQQRKAALQEAVSAWENLIAYRASIDSSRAAIRSATVALDGVERQAIVGTSTTLEVLQQQETLLNAQVVLVQSLSNLVTASYAVAAAAGRLTARDLRLDVPLYNELAYYNAVRDRLWGTNDYAMDQPGR